MADKMAENMFKLKIDFNLVVFTVLLQVFILNVRAMVAISVILGNDFHPKWLPSKMANNMFKLKRADKMAENMFKLKTDLVM